MNSKLTQTEYIPLAEPILVNVINDENNKENEEQMDDDEEDCWGCCCLTIWYIFLFFIGMILFTSIFK